MSGLGIRDFIFLIIVLVANLVQGVSGFAGSLVAMPPSIALFGPDSAKAMVTLLMFVTPLIMMLRNIRHVNWRVLGIIMIFMAVGVVVGNFLYRIAPKEPLMIAYGAIVILIGVVKLIVGDRLTIKKPWNYIALFLAGLMQGAFTSGGPFLVLYAAEAMKDKDEFRATVSSVWVILNTYLIISMFINGMYTSSGESRHLTIVALIALVPALAAVFIGEKLASKINNRVFLIIVYILLIVSGAILIANAVFIG